MYIEVDIDIEDAVKQSLRDINLSDHIDLDYGDIQYHVEDGILEQVMNHVDVDEIAERIQGQKEDLDDAIQDWIGSSCSGVDDVVDELLDRGDRFTKLERTVERLVEHMGLPEERTGEEQIQDLIESGEITLANLETIVANQCDEQRRNMKRMNKTELVYTAQQMGYHVYESMTIAQIHEAVGL
tara:strand:+ start:73 stop:624 length:552 start_codon:yes stop_codon:yes gene_type:complete